MQNQSAPILQVIKIGGSIITSKEKECTFNEAGTLSIGRSLAGFKGPLILVHGTGSFGKPPARKYNYMDGFLDESMSDVVAKVENLLRMLQLKVLDAWMQCGLPVIGVNARELFFFDGRSIQLSQTAILTELLGRKAIPVISGGFIINKEGGFCVCSSDVMATALARELHASQLIFATDQEGVYSTNGHKVLLEQFHASELETVAATDGDVSSGMKGKLEAAIKAAEAGLNTIITDGRDPQNILDLLSGKPAKGTRIIAH
jgi:glutamate 5-kinase